jgi:N-acylneuraminate cytidylyltransferase
MIVKTLITARGGSKCIPKKNIVDVNGSPLIKYSIGASASSDSSETWVSTDDDEIKRVALLCGAKVIDRPKELSGDIIMPDAALVHFAENNPFDVLVFLQPTSPLIEAQYINKGIDAVVSGDYDSCFSAYKEHWLPRWRVDGNPHMWDIDSRPRRQDREELYVENGAMYVTTRQQLLDSGLRYGKKIKIIEMPQYKSFQVDTEDDLYLIRKII